MRSKASFLFVLAILVLLAVLVFRSRIRRPGAEERRLAAAVELIQAGDDREAIRALRVLADRPAASPERREAALLLARTLTRTGEYPEAAAVWEELAALGDPDIEAEAEFHLALLAAREGETAGLDGFIARRPAPVREGAARLARARLRRRAGDLSGAEEDYRRVLALPAGEETLVSARGELGELNLARFSSREGAPGTAVYTVRSGDSLAAIAGRHGTTADLVRWMNRLPSDVIHPGQNLRLPAERFSAVVSKSRNTLTLLYGGEFFKEYSVGTGRDGCSPTGEFTIVTKLIDPPWFYRGEVIPPDDERNILGTRWMGFDDPYAAYGIHGTTEPETVGTQSSDGCVRMRNEEVEELFTFLPRGTRVVIEE